MSDRKYLPTLGELIDRLSINQIKEIKITNHRDEYAKEIEDILHDIQLILDEDKICLNAETIRNIIILSQYNLHIFQNEANCRNGVKDNNDLFLSHGLNSIRCTARNHIQEAIDGKKDYKIDNIKAPAEWVPSKY